MILVSDLNSGIERHNEPEQPGDDLALRGLVEFGRKDNERTASGLRPSDHGGVVTRLQLRK